MAEFSADLRDIKFNLFDFLDSASLTKAERYSHLDGEIFNDVLDMAYKLAAEEFAPLNELGDRVGAVLEDGQVRMPKGFKEAYDAYRELGWFSLTLDFEHGGQQFPSLIHLAAQDLFVQANVSFFFTPGLSHGVIGLVTEFGSDAQHAIYREKLTSGEWAGTMCLTEPQAGTAVPDLKSSATPIEGKPGFFKMKGQKIFITSGDHDLTTNIVHMVLARVDGDPEGSRGVSLFLVPKYKVDDNGKVLGRNDVTTVAIEEKLGIHASSTCQLSFGDDGDCEGWLIGEQGQGLRCMFKMMNEARATVGQQGQSLGAQAYEKALAYARERIQGVRLADMRKANPDRVAIIEHADVRRMLLQMKAVTYASRAMILYTAYCFDQARIATNETDQKRWLYQAEVLTPIIKAWCSDEGFKSCELGIQVHGGYGYIREYGAEQLLRDCKIASIYEGTNGIQALDLVGRKMARGGGVMLMSMLNEFNKLINSPAKEGDFADEIAALAKARDALAGAAMSFQQTMMKGDVDYPALHACSFLQMFGDIVGAWLLIKQAVVANKLYRARLQKLELDTLDEGLGHALRDDSELRFLHGKIATMRFFVHQILPRVRARAASIKSEDRSALNSIF